MNVCFITLTSVISLDFPVPELCTIEQNFA